VSSALSGDPPSLFEEVVGAAGGIGFGEGGARMIVEEAVWA